MSCCVRSTTHPPAGDDDAISSLISRTSDDKSSAYLAKSSARVFPTLAAPCSGVSSLGALGSDGTVAVLLQNFCGQKLELTTTTNGREGTSCETVSSRATVPNISSSRSSVSTAPPSENVPSLAYRRRSAAHFTKLSSASLTRSGVERGRPYPSYALTSSCALAALAASYSPEPGPKTCTAPAAPAPATHADAVRASRDVMQHPASGSAASFSELSEETQHPASSRVWNGLGAFPSMEYPSETSRASATYGRMLCGSCDVVGMPTRAIAGSHRSPSGRSAEHPEMSRSLSVLSPTNNKSAPSSSVNACRGPEPAPTEILDDAGDGEGQRPFPPAYTKPPPEARADADSTPNATSAAARAASSAAEVTGAATAATAAVELSEAEEAEEADEEDFSSSASSLGSSGSFGGSRGGSSGVPGMGSSSDPSLAGLGFCLSSASSPGTAVASAVPSVDSRFASAGTTSPTTSSPATFASR
mmetsp:Transcript_3012/g.12011  ORF Transcript_3012/g.12011 Transcript_3012/m.12011 type:complete len:474 (+) Transcript_3012:362-1783(+)